MKSFRCRCRRKACEARQTTRLHPDEYLRPKKCRCCKKGLLRVDRYRQRIETRKAVCKCFSYSFPHAKGRGWCEHNKRLTERDFEERFSYMGRRAA